MTDIDQAIQSRQELVKKLEDQLEGIKERLDEYRQELSVLISAKLLLGSNSLQPALDQQPPIMFGKTPMQLSYSFGNDRANEARTVPSTLVQEILCVLSECHKPMGPKEIQKELSREGRAVQHNVLTGVLSRLVKKERVCRLERGKYFPKPYGQVVTK